MPSAASTRAVSSANSRLMRRPSRPTTTPRLRDVGHVRLEVAREARGGAAHDRAVHAVGAGAEHAAQAGGAELEPPAEGVAERRPVLCVEELLNFVSRDGVGIVLHPERRSFVELESVHAGEASNPTFRGAHGKSAVSRTPTGRIASPPWGHALLQGAGHENSLCPLSRRRHFLSLRRSGAHRANRARPLWTSSSRRPRSRGRPTRPRRSASTTTSGAVTCFHYKVEARGPGCGQGAVHQSLRDARG